MVRAVGCLPAGRDIHLSPGPDYAGIARGSSPSLAWRRTDR
jgi:hypothetical protein